MTTVTLTSKGQLTLPRPLRVDIGLAPGPRLQASIDRQGRLVLVPSKDEPEDLFLHRPKVNRGLSLEQMEEAIPAGAGSPDDRKDAGHQRRRSAPPGPFRTHRMLAGVELRSALLQL
jgi:bifunctional DNA-binding transcriptional regulator/antitoxin component of YhaV-PrlF toxin-antitoxin module